MGVQGSRLSPPSSHHNRPFVGVLRVALTPHPHPRLGGQVFYLLSHLPCPHHGFFKGRTEHEEGLLGLLSRVSGLRVRLLGAWGGRHVQQRCSYSRRPSGEPTPAPSSVRRSNNYRAPNFQANWEIKSCLRQSAIRNFQERGN